MPQLDAITPNPKQPKRLFSIKPKNAPALSSLEIVRRRRLMWGIVAGVTVVVLVVWFGTLGTRLKSVNGDNSAWNILKQKASDLVSVFRSGGDQKVKNINLNTPTNADIQYLREQVFPNSGAVTASDANAPVNGNVNATTNSNSNVNQPANANAR